MKKKSTRKTAAKRPVRRSGKRGHYIEFFGLGAGMLIGVFAIAGFHTANKPMILGTSIFARGSTDAGIGREGNSGGGISGKEDRGSLGSGKPKIPPGTVVDCVSPDGQHVRQSFEACAALNKASNQSNFSFTVLKSLGKDQTQKMPPPERVIPSGVMMEEKREDKATVLRKNNVRANTSFPVSVDPETNKVFITTSSGKKEVSVLPDAAVERILQSRILSNVETRASSSAFNGDDATLQTTLTELNSKPVFKVKGFSNKKVFGLFPASFAKTVYVSAEDGSVVKTDETFFSKMLENVSF